MDTYILQNALGEYVLAIVNGIVVKTTHRWEAQKYFDLKQAERNLAKINSKKKEFSIIEYERKVI